MGIARTAPARARPLRLESLEERALLAINWSALQEGLAGSYFSELQEQIDPVFEKPMPLAGTRLQGQPASNFFGNLQSRLSQLADLDLASSVTAGDVAEAIKAVLEGYKVATVIPDNPEASEGGASFTMTLVDTYSDASFPLDLGLGENAFMEVWLPEDANVKVTPTVTWEYTVSFQVQADPEQPDEFEFSIGDATQEGDNGVNNLTITLDAELSGWKGYGRVGVFTARMEQDGSARLQRECEFSFPQTGAASPTVRDTSSSLTFDITASAIPNALLPDLLPPQVQEALDTKIDLGTISARAEVQYGVVDLDQDPREAIKVSFSNVSLNLLTVYNDFFRPMAEPVLKAIRPVTSFVNTLLDPLPVVSDLAGKDVCLLDLPRWMTELPVVGVLIREEFENISGMDMDEVLKTLSTAEETAKWVRDVAGEWADLAEAFAEPNHNLGSFPVAGFDCVFSDGTWGPNFGGNPPNGFTSILEAVESLGFGGDIGTDIGKLLGLPDPENSEEPPANVKLDVPILSNTAGSVAALLSGDAMCDLLTVGGTLETGPLTLGRATLPIIPGFIEGAISPTIEAGLNLGAGYDGEGMAEVASAVKRDIVESGARTWNGLKTWVADHYEDDVEEVLHYVSPLGDGFYLDDHSPRSDLLKPGEDTSNREGPADAREGWFDFDLNLSASAGLDIVVLKAMVSLIISPGANFDVDLNDLPSKINGAWPDADELWTYDGRIRPSELDRIWDVDPLAMVNGDLKFTLGLSVGVTLEVLGFTVLDKEFKIAEETLWRKAFGASDADILANLVRNEPVFAHVDDSGTLYLHMHNKDREHTSADRTETDTFSRERFEVRSLGWMDEDNHDLGERVEVTFGGIAWGETEPAYYHRREFENVRYIMALGDPASGNDDYGSETIVIDSTVYAGADLRTGHGNDVLVYQGKGEAQLNGGDDDDMLYGSDGDDFLYGHLGKDRLFGGGGNDHLYGHMPGGGGVKGEDDFLDGGPGDDFLEGGWGNDTYQWTGGGDEFVEDPADPGSLVGVDFVKEDRLLVSGAFHDQDGKLVEENDVIIGGVEKVNGQPTGRAVFTTNSGTFTFVNIESVSIAAGGGADVVILEDLALDTSVRSVAIDLANPNEYETGDRDADTVVYNGQDADDWFYLTSEAGETAWTDLVTGQQDTMEQSVVKLSDGSMEVTILNTHPAHDILRINGHGGNDRLILDEYPASLPPDFVPNLIHVIFRGQEGNDTLETYYRVSSEAPRAGSPEAGRLDFYGGSYDILRRPTDDGATNTLIITGSDYSIADARLVVTDRRVTGDAFLEGSTFVGDFLVDVCDFEFYSVDDLQLNLGSAEIENDVRISSALPGDFTIHDGPRDDRFVVESLPAGGETRIVLDGGGTNTVTVGNGSVDAVRQLKVEGGGGDDRLSYDSSAEEVPIDVEVDYQVGNLDGRKQFRVEGTKNAAIPYSPVVYDNAIEYVVLLLGRGDDRVAVPDLGRRSVTNTYCGRVLVDGGEREDQEGDADEVSVILPDHRPNGMAAAPGVFTSNVETVTFANTTSEIAPEWVMTQGQLRYGDQTVLETSGAVTTDITLGNGVDDLRVEEAWPEQGEIHINLGGGVDHVSFGDQIASIRTNVIVDAGPEAGQGISINDNTLMAGEPRGTLTGESLTDFGMPDGASIEYAGFSAVNLSLLGSVKHELTIENMDLDASVSLGPGLDIVTIRGPASNLGVDGNDGPDILVVAPASDMQPLVGTLEEYPVEDYDARLEFTSPAPARVDFEDFSSLDVQLGNDNDQFDVNWAPSSLSTQIEGNGGDDLVTIRSPGADVDFTPGTGQDTLTIEAANPLTDDYDQVTFATGLEHLVVDDRRTVTGPVEWVVSPAGLSAVGRAEPLLGLQNAEEILLKTGSPNDIVRIEEQSGLPVRAIVDGNRVEFVEPRPYSVCFDAPLAELQLLTGAGGDVVSLVHAAPAERVQVDTAGGEDRVVVLRLSEGETEVNTGPGADRVEIRSPESYGTLTVNTGDDADQIDVMQIGLSSSTAIYAGAGSDTIRVLGYRLQSSVLRMQAGDPVASPGDTLVFDAGGGTCGGISTLPNGEVRVADSSYKVAYTGIEDLQCLENTSVVSATPAGTLEGSDLPLHATATGIAREEDVDFAWDLNGDGDFADATGNATTVTWNQLTNLGIDDDGVYDIAVRLTDGTVVSQAAATLTITNVAPVSQCSVENPNVALGETVRLLFGATDRGDDRIARWQVNWGDGSTVESFPGDLASATHVYQKRGISQINLTAEDEDPDGPYAMPPDLTVNVDAPPPMSYATKYTVYEGGTLRLNGRAAGTPAEWAWDIDGNGDYADAFGKSPALSWSALEALVPGIHDGNADTDGPDDALYHARLRVTYPDGYQTWSQTLVPIYVQNRAPTAALSNGGPVYEGQSVELTLWNPWDPSSVDRDAGFKWVVGGTSYHVVAGLPFTKALEAVHSPVQRMTGTLYDYDGGNTVVFTDVAVFDVPPTLTLAGDGEVDEDAAYTLSWSAEDPGDDVISQWAIDWGDGRRDTVAGSTPSLEHMFVDEGEYVITVTATDGDGSYSAVKTVTANPRPTSLMLVSLPSANEGDAYRLFFTPTTPGNELSRWHIDWGDGSYENVDRNAGSLTHRYADNGSYQITAWAYDAHDPRVRYLVSKVYFLPGPLYGDLAGAGTCCLASAVRGDFETVAGWAEDQGGYLASVNSAEEEARLVQSFILQDGSIFWIGLRQEDSPAAPIPAPQSLLAGWDAAAPGHVADQWSPSYGDLAWAWSPTEPAPVRTNAAPTNRELSHAFCFNVDLDPNQPPTHSFGVANPDFGADDSVATSSASFGLWLRPAGLTGKEVLFEAGSETGTSLRLDGDQLIFRVCGVTETQQRASVLEARTTLTGAEIDDYLHVAATIGLGAGHADRISLYVNGQLRDTAVAPGAGMTRWADADGCGLGGPAGELGGNGAGDLDSFGTFEGWIAQVRFYGGELTPDEVLGEFLSVATGNTLQWESGERVSYVDFAGSQPAPGAEHFVLAGLGGGMAGWDEAPEPLPAAGLYGIVELDGLWRLAGQQLDLLEVTVRDVAPRVALSGPAQIHEGDLFKLTIGALIDPGRDPVSEYRIYWGDNSEPQVITFPAASPPVSSMSVMHRYADDGTYSINLVIVNGDGIFANPQVLTAEVANVAPTITVSAPKVAEEGLPYTLTLGPVVDPGDDATTVRVDWGDGEHTVCAAPGPATHVYPRGPMQHQIRVELWEEGVYSGAVERSVTVLDVPPRIQLSAPASVQEGVPLEFRLGAVADPGGDPVPPIRGYIVDWGDGSWQRLTAPVNLRHTYADGDASRSILVHLVTDTGTIVAAGRAPVLVRNAPPQLSNVAITPANSQNEVTLSGRFYDPGTQDTFTLQVEWGDGISEQWACAASSTSFVKTHRYASSTHPAYRVGVLLSDDDGGSDAEEVTVSVTPVAPGAPGTLDPTFGSGGKVITDFESVFGDGGDEEGGEAALDVAIQLDDGKIVAVGWYYSANDSSEFALARYLPTGELDPDFGTQGRVYTDFGGPSDTAYAVAILSDGKILVSGSGGPGETPGLVLARYTADGRLDTTFGGGDGYVIENYGSLLYQGSLGLAVATDGTIYVPVAGPSPSWGGVGAGIASFHSDGTRNTDFGDDGVAMLDLAIYPMLVSGPADLALDRDGNLLLLCQPQTTDDYRYYFAIAKYDLTLDGLDPDFGSRGWAFTEFGPAGTGAYPFRLAVDPESGRIVAVGYVSGWVPESFAIACYTPDGQLDPSFGDQGKVVPDLAEFGRYDGIATGVAIQSDGKVVVLGFTRSEPGAPQAFSALRLNANGEIDKTFGTGGLVTITFNPYSDFGIAMAIQGDNSIVLAGATYNQPSPPWIWWFGIDPDFALARLFGDPLPPPVVKKVTVSSDRRGLGIQLNDSDLDPALATNPANFRLTAARSDTNRDGNYFGDADDQVWTINSDSITYDPATDKITLRFATQMNDRFRLQIDGDDSTGDGTPGLLSRAGSFLSGGDYTRDLDLRTTLTFTATCPVRLEAWDTWGRVVTRDLNEIPDATYWEADLDGDGDLDVHEITVLGSDSEEYWVRVVPEPDADPEATVTLIAREAKRQFILLEDVPIGTLGPDPEPIPVTVDRTPPTITIAADPGVLQPAETWVPVGVTIQAQDETDPSPQVVLVDIAPSWETDPAAVIYAAEYGQSDDQFSLKAERGEDLRFYTLTYAASDASGNIAYATAIVAVGNSQPVAMPGEDLTAEEGQAVSFDGTASTDADGDTLSYFWDFGDGSTAEGPSPTHVFADDGSYTVTLTVDDGYFGGRHSDTLLVTVHNAAPVVAPIAGPDTGVRGQQLCFSGSFEDPGALDQHAVSWHVFKASTLVAAGSGLDFAFTPTTVGNYTVAFTVSDADGGSGSQSRSVSVQAIGVQPEPEDPTKVALVVGGTTGNDNILVTPGLRPGHYLVWMNCLWPDCVAAPEGTSFDRIVVYGQAGDDDIVVLAGSQVSSWLYGEGGNDRLMGGAGSDVLLGGPGNDLLVGSFGRDLLIGGLGADQIAGNADDDILISGTTAYDAHEAALRAIMTEWTTPGRSYVDRTTNLRNAFLRVEGPGCTVFDDNERDLLAGDSGRDWFFANLCLDQDDDARHKDKIVDMTAFELALDLDWIAGA